MSSLYADIVLPLAQNTYTFSVADNESLQRGDAVVVQFGPKRYYTGIVWRLHDRRPDFPRIKSITRRLYSTPLLSEGQIALWEWIADYYMCTLGEVMRVALPSMIKPSGDDMQEFADEEFTPRKERYLAIADGVTADEESLSQLLDKMERRAPRQYEIMTTLLRLATESGTSAENPIPRRLVVGDAAAIAALIRKGLIRSEMIQVEENAPYRAEFLPPKLTASQQKASEDILRGWQTTRTVLLHGVTGSGKTEIYINHIADTLRRGGDVLMLVPEIALTAQLIDRMESIFGARVTAYHSKLTDRRRTETYLRLSKSSGGEFVIGARSALFLPLRHLQLVIVDEEHDTGYKQEEPSPRYNARDMAVVLAHLLDCHTLLGSATPSLESYYNTLSGKYSLVTLTERYGGAQLPEIIISDTLRAVKRGERYSHFNKLLLDDMDLVLNGNGQVMLFQNRRGFAPYIECTSCGWTARCPNCNVTLTLHKGSSQRLECHYCSYTMAAPAKCPACHIADVVPMGFGTEKAAEEISKIFPDARIVRLDRDTATSERAYRKVIDDFASHRADVMVGTQMISKGFDFGGVALVGVLNADNLLRSPDFRASERAFQLLTQVSGRAGRRQSDGRVIIQTAEADHAVLHFVRSGDYRAMVERELSERRAFNYPPYAHIVALTLRHADHALLCRCAEQLACTLRARFGRRVLGPTAPPVDRIRGEYILRLMVKIETTQSFARARKIMREELSAIRAAKGFSNVTIICDVDPQ